MEINTHCEVCKLCSKPGQHPGSQICKDKITGKFKSGYWDNGIEWVIIDTGRVLTKDTLIHTYKEKRVRQKNTNTKTHVVSKYTPEHEEVLREWTNDISGFKRAGHIEKYIFYLSSHPFSLIVEFRIDGYLIGFSWLLVIDKLVFHHAFAWRKKRLSQLSLGTFEKVTLIDLWPDHTHYLGLDTAFKSKLGGCTYAWPPQPDQAPEVSEKQENAESNATR
jgi:hypothetical protein